MVIFLQTELLVHNLFQIHYKRMPNSCFVNNYFKEGPTAWEENMDIHPVFNHYKAVAYMCSYLSKSETECSLAMAQPVREAFGKDLDIYEQVNAIAKIYLNRKEYVSKKVCIIF